MHNIIDWWRLRFFWQQAGLLRNNKKADFCGYIDRLLSLFNSNLFIFIRLILVSASITLILSIYLKTKISKRINKYICRRLDNIAQILLLLLQTYSAQVHILQREEISKTKKLRMTTKGTKIRAWCLSLRNLYRLEQQTHLVGRCKSSSNYPTFSEHSMPWLCRHLYEYACAL